MTQSSNKQSGLTLIELITTIAIIGILAGLAIPAYDRYTRSSTRPSAKAVLEQVRSRMESYYVNNKSYTNDLTDIGYAADPFGVDKTGNIVAVASAEAVYQIDIVACANCNYQLEATPLNSQLNDGECTKFVLNALGQKTATGTKGNKCW